VGKRTRRAIDPEHESIGTRTLRGDAGREEMAQFARDGGQSPRVLADGAVAGEQPDDRRARSPVGPRLLRRPRSRGGGGPIGKFRVNRRTKPVGCGGAPRPDRSDAYVGTGSKRSTSNDLARASSWIRSVSIPTSGASPQWTPGTNRRVGRAGEDMAGASAVGRALREPATPRSLSASRPASVGGQRSGPRDFGSRHLRRAPGRGLMWPPVTPLPILARRRAPRQTAPRVPGAIPPGAPRLRRTTRPSDLIATGTSSSARGAAGSGLSPIGRRTTTPGVRVPPVAPPRP
jgi:hypothetical protein